MTKSNSNSNSSFNFDSKSHPSADDNSEQKLALDIRAKEETKSEGKTAPLRCLIYDLKMGEDARKARCAEVSHCGDYVAILDDERKVYVKRIGTRETFKLPIFGNASAFALNEDSEIAVATDQGLIQRFDIKLPTICLGTISAGSVTSIAYHPLGHMLISGLANGWTKVFDLASQPAPTLIGSQRVADDRPIRMIMAREDMVIGVDKGGRIFCLRNFDSKPSLSHYGNKQLDWDCWAMAMHPFSHQLVVGGSGPYIRHYRNLQNSPSFLISSFSFIRDLVFLDSTGQLAVIGNDGVEIMDLDKQETVFSWKNDSGNVLCARAKLDRLIVICG